MTTKILVGALVVLAVAVAVDGIKQARSDDAPASTVGGNSYDHRWLVRLGGRGGYGVVKLRDRVLLRGREHLRSRDIERAFPGPARGRPIVSKLARAHDGTIALGVVRLPPRGPATAAVEVWRQKRLLSAFRVPSGSFSLGLWFAGDGSALALFAWDGSSRLYDRGGRRIAGVAYVAYETR